MKFNCHKKLLKVCTLVVSVTFSTHTSLLSFPPITSHAQPEFSEKPLNTEAERNNWLKFYEMSAPLICLSVFISHDPVSSRVIQSKYMFTLNCYCWYCYIFVHPITYHGQPLDCIFVVVVVVVVVAVVVVVVVFYVCVR